MKDSWVPLAVMLLVLGVIGLLVALSSSPVEVLLGDSRFALEGALHGVVALLFMVTATVGLFQAYRLWVGSLQHIEPLEFGSALNALLAFLTILFGNRIYMFYRAAEGPRTYFLENLPQVHEIFFEFKEFAALFTLPLATAAAFLFFTYREQLLRSRGLRNIAAMLLVLTFFYFLVAFGLGAAITKLRAL